MKPYYETELGQLYHGDCIEVMRHLPNVDLIITSPPYNMGVSSGGGIKGAGKKGLWQAANRGGLGEGYESYSDNMPWDKYEEWQKDFLSVAWNCLTDKGAIFYNHKPRVQDGLVRLPTRYNPGLPIRQIITWVRPNGFNFSNSHYLPSYEWVLLIAKENFRLKSKGASGISDVWHMTPKKGDGHPCPFPYDLPMNILNTTKSNFCLDPFSGEGTTPVSCERLNRKWIGIEISEKYCEIAAKRIENERKQLKLF
jgi:modification methylase